MSTISAPADKAVSLQRSWMVAAVLLTLGVVLFGAAFKAEILSAVDVWEKSTAYNHCFLILPISMFLIWERRQALFVRIPTPSYWALAALAPVGFVWLVGVAAGIMEGRQLAVMTLFQLFVLAVVGFRVWRVIAFAMLYLFFLVPVGAFLTPYLQGFAAEFAVRGLHLLGILVYSDGMEIDVPGARFVVAEACAGLRFLIASVALGTLYGYMMYRSWPRRAAFILASIVVPVIANGLRVLGIVVLGFFLGNAQAAVADHLIYGWVFFSAVSFVLILAGTPFRQPVPAFPITPADKTDIPRSQTSLIFAGAIAAGFIVLLISPAVADGLLTAALRSALPEIKHTTAPIAE
jgi:exosortase A